MTWGRSLDLSKHVSSSRKMGAIVPRRWACRGKQVLIRRCPQERGQWGILFSFESLAVLSPGSGISLVSGLFNVVWVKYQGPETVCFWLKHKWLLATETNWRSVDSVFSLFRGRNYGTSTWNLWRIKNNVYENFYWQYRGINIFL